MRFAGVIHFDVEAGGPEDAQGRVRKLVTKMEDHAPRLGIDLHITTFTAQSPPDLDEPAKLFDATEGDQ